MFVAALTILGLALFPASWLFGVVEHVAAARFVEWAFRSGLVVLRYEAPCAPPSRSVMEVRTTANGKFKRLPNGSVLVRDQWPVLALRVNTPCPLRGTAVFENGRVLLLARVPLGPSVFLALWLAWWCMAGIVLFLMSLQADREVPFRAVVFMLFVPLVVAPMAALCLRLERLRIMRAFRQMLQVMSEHETPRPI